MTSLRTLIVSTSLLSCICYAQMNVAQSHGILGLRYSQIEVDVAPPDQPTPDYQDRLLIGEVVPDSPASKTVIKPGDVILYVNGVAANKAAVEVLNAADSVDLLLQRPDGTTYTVFSLHRATGLPLSSRLVQNDAERQKVVDGYFAVERIVHPSTADASTPAANLAAMISSLDEDVKRTTEVSTTSNKDDAAASPSFQPDPALNSKPNGSDKGLNGMMNAANGQIAGTWAGGKSEHDYLHGGYVSADWTFVFSANGTYEEEVYVGGQEAMSAGGTYTFTPASKPGDRTVTHMLTFRPNSVETTNSDLARVAASFPVPIRAAVSEYINFFRLSDGNTMMLQDAERSGSESWQMKRR